MELRSAQKIIELLQEEINTTNSTFSAPEEILSNIKIELDDSELELQISLKKAWRLKLQEAVTESKNSVEKVAESVLERNSAGNTEGGSIVLNATAEFCHTLGDIPTYGLAGNRDENAQELLDFEREMIERKKCQEEESKRRAWNEIEIDDEKFGHHKQYSGPTLDSEEDEEEEEEEGYRPDVKLDYTDDDDGHVLNAKEAFRYLSHKFYGKGPGRNKAEKRMKI